MDLVFRNVDAVSADAVETWGFEGLLTAIDRGEAAEWRRISRSVAADPWGPLARLLEEEVIPAASDSGVAGAMGAMIALQRERAEAGERAAVRAELTELLQASGLTQGAFATRLGTSRPRLNTYLTGKVVPAATVLVRARRIAKLSG